MKKREYKKRYIISPVIIYFGVVFTSILFSIFNLIRNKGSLISDLSADAGADYFMDFMNHISYVRGGLSNVYYFGMNANFPPLIYLMYYFFCEILPSDATSAYNAYASKQSALLLFVVYNCFLCLLLYFGVIKNFKNKSLEYSSAFLISILLSYNFIFGVIERGNSAGIVAGLILLIVYFQDSDTKWKRELALILIAIVASIKVYPALLGLIYVCRRQIKESVRLLIYGILFFFVPFIWTGGINGFSQFLLNQQELQDKSIRGFQSLNSLVNYVLDKIGFVSNSFILNICIILIFAVVSFVLLFILDEVWKKYALIMILMICLPFWSARYTLFYLIIPTVLFFKKETWNTVDYIYAFIFG